MKYLKYLWHITSGFHRTAILRTLLGILRVVLLLTFIWLSKTAIDCATGRIHAETATLLRWFGLMVVCMVTNVSIAQWISYIETRAALQMNLTLGRRLFNILMVVPLVRGRQGFHSGDMLNRLTLDVRTVSNFALVQLPAMIVMLAQLIGAFIFLASLNPYLALAPLVIMPICILASKLYFRRQRSLTAEIRQGESDMHVAIQDGLMHRIIIRTLECTATIDSRLGGIQQHLDSTNREKTRLARISGLLVQLGFALGYLTAFGWSIFSLSAGIITFGTMTAFIQLVNRIQHPIASISGYIPTLISTTVALDRLREIDFPHAGASAPGFHAAERRDCGPNAMSTPRPSCAGASAPGFHAAERRDCGPNAMSTPRPSCAGASAQGHGEAALSQGEDLLPITSYLLLKDPPGIRIRDLSFRYDDATPAILSSFSHDFRPGSRTMITGATGAGKTTLIRLLLGLLTPDRGSIEIYGDGARSHPVSAATISNFAYVPQGNSLLHGTIRENLLLARPDATDEQLAEALHIAAADFVFGLPLGLDTPCDETGGGLSEGQAQRIAIARALLRPGRILLLDEFNSALDADTAALLMQRLADARPHATVIIIAHHRTAIAPYCHDQLVISNEVSPLTSAGSAKERRQRTDGSTTVTKSVP